MFDLYDRIWFTNIMESFDKSVDWYLKLKSIIILDFFFQIREKNSTKFNYEIE
jgi:hypothetical protein